jgi:hypothetical protein
MNNCSNWKLSDNERIPPTCTPFWSYDSNSWSWRPKILNTNTSAMTQSNINSLSSEYLDYIKEDISAPYPLITSRGGLSSVDISALEESSYNFPDIQSETEESKIILYNYWKMLEEKKMLPQWMGRPT